MTTYKTFSERDLLELNYSKEDLAEKIGINCTYDTALPQQWLNEFVKKNNLDYNMVRYSSFTIYEESGLGRIVSAWDTVQNLIMSDLDEDQKTYWERKRDEARAEILKFEGTLDSDDHTAIGKAVVEIQEYMGQMNFATKMLKSL